jgi:Domain of unknown function (DUF932)
MKQQLTPQEFAAKVQALDATKIDHVSTTDRLRFHSNGDTVLSIDGVEDKYPVNDVAHAQIATRLGIPKPYYDRMRSTQPALLDANVATWMHNPVERRLVRTLEGKVRAFLSDRYQRIDNLDILQAIAGPFQHLTAEFGAYVVSSALTDTKMYVKVVVPGIEAEVKVGDVVQAGFVISNSETGHGSFSVEQMLFRLVCSNGMIVGEKLSRRHVGGRIAEGDIFSDRTRRLDDQTVLSAARDLIEAAVDESRFNGLVARMRETVNTAPSVNPISTVETLAKTNDLSDEEQGRVLSAFITDAPQNGLGLFGVVNAVTRASQEVEDYERATELEKLGGVLLATPAKEWEKLAGITG